jgi:hypothetical protein
MNAPMGLMICAAICFGLAIWNWPATTPVRVGWAGLLFFTLAFIFK